MFKGNPNKFLSSVLIIDIKLIKFKTTAIPKGSDLSLNIRMGISEFFLGGILIDSTIMNIFLSFGEL